MATHTRRVGSKRPTRTKAERAAIAARMRAYHAKRRAAKARAASGITGSRHPEGAVPMAPGTEAVSPLDATIRASALDAVNREIQTDSLMRQLRDAEQRTTDLLRCVVKLIDRGGY